MFYNDMDLLQVGKKLSLQDFPVIQFGGWEEGHYACMDCAAQFGTIFELLDFRK